MTTLTPYLFFGGRCEEALSFYAEALSGRATTIIRMGEAMKDAPDEHKGLIIHSLFEAKGLSFMASDGMPGEPPDPGGPVSLALGFDTTEEQERVWAKLVEGGTVLTALHGTFYGGRMGVLTDRFGMRWMLNWSPPAKE
jgi:PhnB protein